MNKICDDIACMERFEKIEEQLHKGDVKFTELGIKLDNLVAALWGLASSIIIAFISFALGKI